MNEQRVPEKIDYIIHEGIMVRQERIIRRMWITSMILLVTVMATNIGWVVWALHKSCI